MPPPCAVGSILPSLLAIWANTPAWVLARYLLADTCLSGGGQLSAKRTGLRHKRVQRAVWRSNRRLFNERALRGRPGDRRISYDGRYRAFVAVLNAEQVSEQSSCEV